MKSIINKLKEVSMIMILLVIIPSFLTCNSSLFTKEELSSIKGDIKTLSDIIIDHQPQSGLIKITTLSFDFRIYYHRGEYLSNEIKDINKLKYSGNIIETILISDTYYRNINIDTFIIPATKWVPENFYKREISYIPKLLGAYWFEIYERNPYTNKRILLAVTDKAYIYGEK